MSTEKLLFRPLEKGDFRAYSNLARSAQKKASALSREEFETCLRVFPRGQIGIEYDGKLLAAFFNVIIDTALRGESHFSSLLQYEQILKKHDSHGDSLFCFHLRLARDSRKLNLARRVLDRCSQLAREESLHRVVVRILPYGYKKHSQNLAVRDYLSRVQDGNLRDLMLESLSSNGYVLRQSETDTAFSQPQENIPALFFELSIIDYHEQSHKRYVPSRLVRICAVQYQMRSIAGFSNFAAQCEYFTDVASDYRCDFVLFPELLTTQLLSCVESKEARAAARELTKYTEQYLELFNRLALQYNINIIGGTHFLLEGDQIFNVAHLFKRDGEIDSQKKIHITPAERRWWGVQPGDQIKVFDTDRGRIAIQICYDIEFPEMSRLVSEQGVEMIFVPFCTDERHGYLRVRHCAIARCIENHVYVAAAGTVGNLPQVECMDIQYAQSGIFTPSDFAFARDCIAAECTPNVETVVIHDVDLETSRRHRSDGATLNWKDRRLDLYELKLRK